MVFTELPLAGAFVIDPEVIADERGSFARVFCGEEFRKLGLETDYVQCSISANAKRGTLRGMHYQARPHEEAKLVRCTAGEIFDVIVDIRPGSRSFGKWAAMSLSAENRRMMYVPRGFAHGYQTLTDAAEIFYQISAPYNPDASRGFRWNDPSVGIPWPCVPPVALSARDRELPLLAV